MCGVLGDFAHDAQRFVITEPEARLCSGKTRFTIGVSVKRLNPVDSDSADALKRQGDVLVWRIGPIGHLRQLVQLSLVKFLIVEQVEVRHQPDEPHGIILVARW